MNASHSHPLIERTSRDWQTPPASLPPGERNSLIDDIREHISVTLGEAEHVDETTIRNLLTRLGPPEEVIEAATGGTASPAPPATPSDRPTRGGILEMAALVTLTLSLLIPTPLSVLGWAAGVALASTSRIWSRREKLIAAVGIPLPVLAAQPNRLTHWAMPDVGVPLLSILISLLIVGPVTAAYLAWRLAPGRARPRHVPCDVSQ
jgi:hypothetical protein